MRCEVVQDRSILLIRAIRENPAAGQVRKRSRQRRLARLEEAEATCESRTDAATRGLRHGSDAFIKSTINNQVGTGTFRPTFVLKRRPFAKNSRRIEINAMVRVVLIRSHIESMLRYWPL